MTQVFFLHFSLILTFLKIIKLLCAHAQWIRCWKCCFFFHLQYLNGCTKIHQFWSVFLKSVYGYDSYHNATKPFPTTLKARATGTIVCKGTKGLLGHPIRAAVCLDSEWLLAFLTLVVFHTLLLLSGQHWSCCFLSTALHEWRTVSSYNTPL